MRILVLWNACAAISREADARWAEEESAKLGDCTAVRALALHPVRDATLRHPRHWDWCLELTVDGEPDAVVRARPCAEFLADLRLLGTHPAVVILPPGPA